MPARLQAGLCRTLFPFLTCWQGAKWQVNLCILTLDPRVDSPQPCRSRLAGRRRLQTGNQLINGCGKVLTVSNRKIMSPSGVRIRVSSTADRNQRHTPGMTLLKFLSSDPGPVGLTMLNAPVSVVAWQA